MFLCDYSDFELCEIASISFSVQPDICYTFPTTLNGENIILSYAVHRGLRIRLLFFLILNFYFKLRHVLIVAQNGLTFFRTSFNIVRVPRLTLLIAFFRQSTTAHFSEVFPMLREHLQRLLG